MGCEVGCYCAGDNVIEAFVSVYFAAKEGVCRTSVWRYGGGKGVSAKSAEVRGLNSGDWIVEGEFRMLNGICCGGMKVENGVGLVV